MSLLIKKQIKHNPIDPKSVKEVPILYQGSGNQIDEGFTNNVAKDWVHNDIPLAVQIYADEKDPVVQLKGTGNYGDSPAFGSMDTRDINIYFSKNLKERVRSSIIYDDNW